MEDCPCTTKALSLRTFRDGTRHYCHQCIICGRASAFLKKEDAEKLISEGVAVSPFDDNRTDRYYALRVAHEREEREMTSVDKKKEYAEYLNTVNWRTIRTKVLKRCNGLCEGCAEKPAAHVHHTTYENVYDELLFKLVGLCEECHKKSHDGANG